MQVFEPTPNHLALSTRPNWLMMCLGALLICLGCVTVMVPGKATTLTLTRSPLGTGAGEIHVKTVLRDYRIVRIPLRMIHGALVTPRSFAGREPHFFHLDLDVRDGLGGPYYFAWYANRDRVEADAARINAFVADPKANELVVTNDKRGIYFPIGGALAIIGAILLLWASHVVRATFDRPASKVTVLRRGMLGTNVDVVPFADIKAFDVAGLSGDCQLYMELASGRRIPLSSSQDMQNMIGPRRIRALRLEDAARIRAFCSPAPLPLGEGGI